MPSLPIRRPTSKVYVSPGMSRAAMPPSSVSRPAQPTRVARSWNFPESFRMPVPFRSRSPRRVPAPSVSRAGRALSPAGPMSWPASCRSRRLRVRPWAPVLSSSTPARPCGWPVSAAPLARPPSRFSAALRTWARWCSTVISVRTTRREPSRRRPWIPSCRAPCRSACRTFRARSTWLRSVMAASSSAPMARSIWVTLVPSSSGP